MKPKPLLFLSLWFVIGILALGAVYSANLNELEVTETPTPVKIASAATTLTAEETETVNQLIAVLAAPINDLDTNCIDCHSNAELLQQLAEEEDVPDVPSEGSG